MSSAAGRRSALLEGQGGRQTPEHGLVHPSFSSSRAALNHGLLGDKEGVGGTYFLGKCGQLEWAF